MKNDEEKMQSETIPNAGFCLSDLVNCSIHLQIVLTLDKIEDFYLVVILTFPNEVFSTCELFTMKRLYFKDNPNTQIDEKNWTDFQIIRDFETKLRELIRLQIILKAEENNSNRFKYHKSMKEMSRFLRANNVFSKKVIANSKSLKSIETIVYDSIRKSIEKVRSDNPPLGDLLDESVLYL